jgi:hypothetical protein
MVNRLVEVGCTTGNDYGVQLTAFWSKDVTAVRQSKYMQCAVHLNNGEVLYAQCEYFAMMQELGWHDTNGQQVVDKDAPKEEKEWRTSSRAIRI